MVLTKVPITFTEQDFKLKSTDHNDAMVIEVNITGWVIGKILVDNGSSADILFMKTFEKMSLSPHMLQPPEYPLLGFGGKLIKPAGKIALPHYLYPSEILTMPELKLLFSTWLTCIIHISQFSTEDSLIISML
jgi:hypothetical protein